MLLIKKTTLTWKGCVEIVAAELGEIVEVNYVKEIVASEEKFKKMSD